MAAVAVAAAVVAVVAAPSKGVGSVAASAAAPTLRFHHAFVQLPDDNYEPRAYDPRSSLGGNTYQDYSVPLGEP